MESGVAAVNQDVLRVDGQQPTARHGIACIERQIDQDLFELARVGLYGPKVRLCRGRQLNVLTDGSQQHVLHRAHQIIEVEYLALDYFPLREGQELAGQVGGALSSGVDMVDIVAGGLLVLNLLLGEYGIVEDHRQEVVEIVRHAAGEPAETLESLDLQHSGFKDPIVPLQRHTCRNVACDGRGSDGYATIVFDRRDRQGNIEQRAVLVQSLGVMMLDLLTSCDRLERRHRFGPSVGRDDQEDTLADRLFGCIAVHPLCALVPTRDGAVEIFGDNGIVGRTDDGGQKDGGIEFGRGINLQR